MTQIFADAGVSFSAGFVVDALVLFRIDSEPDCFGVVHSCTEVKRNRVFLL